MSLRTALFLGPTLGSLDDVPIDLSQITTFPPIKMGDIYRIFSQGYQRIVIADGFFHNVPSIWHREILTAIDSGIEVWGCSSMGALRAAELVSFGMCGYGTVFDWFRSGYLTADDEVAVVHAATPPYDSLSIPLVNVRYACHLLLSKGVLQPLEVQSIITAIKQVYFPDRTLEWISDLGNFIRAPTSQQNVLWHNLLNSENSNIKKIDLLGLLEKLFPLDRSPAASQCELICGQQDFEHRRSASLPFTCHQSNFDNSAYMQRQVILSSSHGMSRSQYIQSLPSDLLTKSSQAASLLFLFSTDPQLITSVLKDNLPIDFELSIDGYLDCFLEWFGINTLSHLSLSTGLLESELMNIVSSFFLIEKAAYAFCLSSDFSKFQVQANSVCTGKPEIFSFPGVLLSDLDEDLPTLIVSSECFFLEKFIGHYDISMDLIESFASAHLPAELCHAPPSMVLREVMSRIGPSLFGHQTYEPELLGSFLFQLHHHMDANRSLLE